MNLTEPPRWVARLTWASLLTACAALGGIAAWAVDQWKGSGVRQIATGRFATQPPHTYRKNVPDRGGMSPDEPD